MKVGQIKKLTPYREINEIMAYWVENVKNILDGDLVGLYLGGSLAYGDFVRGRSDIDLEAVVKKPLTENELKSIDNLHKDINKRFPEWKNRVECSYVPRAMMGKVLPPKTPRPWWGFDKLYKAAPPGNEWTINHYLLAKHGVALFGPDFKTLVPQIDIKDVQKASARDLFKEWVPKIDDPKWLGNGHYQSYLVLNLARILQTVIASRPGSKRSAAAWAKKTYSEWKGLIDEAENWTYGAQMKRNGEVTSFIKFVVAKVNETGIIN